MSLVKSKYIKYKIYIWTIGGALFGAFILGPIMGGTPVC